MSNIDENTGDVIIPLRMFRELEARSRELDRVKKQLKEEQNKTWKLFGNFFEKKTGSSCVRRQLHHEKGLTS